MLWVSIKKLHKKIQIVEKKCMRRVADVKGNIRKENKWKNLKWNSRDKEVSAPMKIKKAEKTDPGRYGPTKVEEFWRLKN